ncbi:hypothetical protein SUGI_0566950 [Cryptomeria japonica]|nr:hypothetical protein SUGI_0566950 [Cryptomeria japonica]
MGVVPLLVEMLVDEDQSVCERESLHERLTTASAHALTLPVVFKRLFRVSGSITNLTVFIFKNSFDKGDMREVLHAGALYKLLLLVQVGCFEKTMDKSTKLNFSTATQMIRNVQRHSICIM